jgi:hypothetical protein
MCFLERSYRGIGFDRNPPCAERGAHSALTLVGGVTLKETPLAVGGLFR